MSDWFLLNRINVPSNHLPIDQKMELAANILANTTEANLSFRNVAISGTSCTPNP